MASSSLLDSKLIDKLQVNRLDAQKIRSNNIASLTPSYLFSAVFNGNFTRNLTGGTLTFNINDVDSIIQFSDRPFRQTQYIKFEQFVSIFTTGTFVEDPPNCVLVNKEEQKTYTIKLESIDMDIVRLNLELLPGETHNLENINGKMNIFIDNSPVRVGQNITYYNPATREVDTGRVVSERTGIYTSRANLPQLVPLGPPNINDFGGN